MIVTLLVILAFLAGAHAGDTHATVLVCSYKFDAGAGPPDHFNRFVTNDVNDFLPDSIRHDKTTVAVGGGNVTSPCTGTVLVKSLDYGHIYMSSNALTSSTFPNAPRN